MTRGHKTCLGPKHFSHGKRGPERSKHRQEAERIGMTRGDMYRCLAIASIPDDEFERLLATARRDGKQLTSARIVGIGRTYQRGHDARPRLRPTKAALSELREMLVLAVDTGDGTLVEAAIDLIDRMDP